MTQNPADLLMRGNQHNPGNKMEYPGGHMRSSREHHAHGEMVGREHHMVGCTCGSTDGHHMKHCAVSKDMDHMDEHRHHQQQAKKPSSPAHEHNPPRIFIDSEKRDRENEKRLDEIYSSMENLSLVPHHPKPQAGHHHPQAHHLQPVAHHPQPHHGHQAPQIHHPQPHHGHQVHNIGHFVIDDDDDKQAHILDELYPYVPPPPHDPAWGSKPPTKKRPA